jgi:general secretion pathway protein D
MELIKLKPVLISIAALLVFGCAEIEPKPFEPSSGHIKSDTKPEGQIPDLVQKTPVLPAPQPPVELEKYTVVVNEVPAKELLFALARDARINVDIDPRIDGNVTINAVDQTLPQILDRIARQIDMRYEFRGDNLFIEPDMPFFRTYKINYLNISRDTESEITIATQIATTGGAFEGEGGGGAGSGNNNSTTSVRSVAKNRFWQTLVANINAIVGDASASTSGTDLIITENVIPNPETGILTVKATAKGHQRVQELIDNVVGSANRQVLIQATILEVELNEQYQAGIDWDFLLEDLGIAVASSTLVGVPVTAQSLLSFVFDDPNATGDDDTLKVTINLLDEFGNVKVLSSPQLMALNNQTAILKVVDNTVFFTIEAETTQNQLNTLTTVETKVHTVPVGIVMPITPHINDNDSVVLNVRPTISRIADEVQDPNPTLRFSPDGTPLAQPIPSLIPEIRVREMESVLRMNNGQIAVLGGLMQDSERDDRSGVPVASKAPLLGKAFESKSKQYSKTELVIFLRPTIVRDPSLDGDLQYYKTFLERSDAETTKRQGVTHP